MRKDCGHPSRFATREGSNCGSSLPGTALATALRTMLLRRIPLFAYALLAAACTDTIIKNDPFVGNWSCNGSSTTSFSQPPNTPNSTDTTQATVSHTDDGNGNITTVRNPIDAGPPCTLHSTLSADGNSLTLKPGQTCSTANGGTVSYTSGSSSLNSDGTYTSNSTWTLNGTTAKGAPLVGTGTGNNTCTKM
jgi:hypothetical protein